MTEEDKNNKYIICSNCRSKYINDEEHINKDFGYTRLEMRYKTCVKCRARSKTNNNNNYHEEHKDSLNERNKQYRDNNKERIK